MSNLDQAWGSVSADGDGSFEKNPPPIGYMGCPVVADIRVGTTKPEKGGDRYFAVDFVDGDYRWGVFKKFTKNGQPHEGSIKSAKITLRQLGLDVPSPAQLEGALKTIIGRYYAVEQRAGSINPTTGQPYANTEITGPASPPTMAAPAQQAPAPQVQAPAPVPAPVAQAMAQAPQGQTLEQAMAAAEQQHGIVPGAVQPAQAPGAQFGDTPPWS